LQHLELLKGWGHTKLANHLANGGQPEAFDEDAPEHDYPPAALALRDELNEFKLEPQQNMQVEQEAQEERGYEDGGYVEPMGAPSYDVEDDEAEFRRRMAKKLSEQTGKEVRLLGTPRGAKDYAINSAIATMAGGASDIANFGLQGIDYLREQAAKQNKRGYKRESLMGGKLVPPTVEPYASEKPFMGGEQFRDLYEKYGITSKGSKDQFPLLGMVPEFALNPVGPLAMVKAAKAVPEVVKGAKNLPRVAESGANTLVSDVRRPFTPATFTVEATAPDLGQGTSYGFRQGLNDVLLANPKLGTGKTKAREGQGTYVNTKGELELNPLQAIDVPRAGNINEGPKANKKLRQQVAQMGVDLNQEAMAGHRFLPMMTNNIKDASAMLIKTKDGLTKEQIADLARMLGSDMAISHNPKLGGIVVFPYDAVTKGKIPQEFLDAQSAAKKVLGKDAKIQYGKSDYEKDRLFMTKSEYEGAGAKPMSAEQQALRRKIQGLEKFMFPESVSGIPGSVKAAPMGGLQPWSRGADYPTNVIGIGNGEKVEYQPVNFLTSAEGKRYPTYREAEKERASMLDDYHRTFPSKVR